MACRENHVCEGGVRPATVYHQLAACLLLLEQEYGPVCAVSVVARASCGSKGCEFKGGDVQISDGDPSTATTGMMAVPAAIRRDSAAT